MANERFGWVQGGTVMDATEKETDLCLWRGQLWLAGILDDLLEAHWCRSSSSATTSSSPGSLTVMESVRPWTRAPAVPGARGR